MKLKEFKKALNKIPKAYDNADVSFIYNGEVHTVQDVKNDIEWYEHITRLQNLIDIIIH